MDQSCSVCEDTRGSGTLPASTTTEGPNPETLPLFLPLVLNGEVSVPDGQVRIQQSPTSVKRNGTRRQQGAA